MAHGRPQPPELSAAAARARGLFNLDSYHNPLVDRLLRSADRADDPATSLSLYREAERVVLRDWHHIPLWFDYHQAVHSERVTEVSLGPFGHVRLSRVTPGPDPAHSPGGTGGEPEGTSTP